MADSKQTDTKALPGSMEEQFNARREAISLSLMAVGFPCWITDTFADYVIVCAGQESDGDTAFFRVDFTEVNGQIIVGAITPVDKVSTYTETLVPEDQAEDAMMGGAGEDMGMALDDMGAMMGMTSDTGLSYKSFDIDTKAITQTTINGVPGFTFEGYYSEWDTVDNEGDITRPGFTDYSLQKWGLPPVRYEHAMNAGVTLEVKSDARGPWMKGFVPDDPQTSLMYKLMKVGGVAKMSYGYKILPGGAARLPTGERELKAIRLMEISPVAIPMHDGTQITAVKADLADGPVKAQLRDAAATLYATTARMKSFVATRMVKRGTGELGDDNWDAIAVFAAALTDALADVVGIEAKAGRTTAMARWKLIAQLRDKLMELIDSIPENERAAAAEAEPTKDTGKGASPTAPTPTPSGKGENGDTSGDVNALEMALLTNRLAHHGRRITSYGD